MKITKQDVYRCEYCRHKPFLNKNWCERHEVRCLGNPTNHRKCFSCLNLKTKNSSPPWILDIVEGLWCNHHKEFLVKPNEDRTSIDDIRMPRKCQWYRK